MLNALGSEVWAARYDAWGKIEYLYGPREQRVENPLRLQGQYADEETGLYYNRFRYFDPVSGGFVSQDPLGIFAGENIYAYAPNIFSWADPLGLSCGKVNTWNAFQKTHKGKFASRAEAARAYKKLLTEQSPWPIGYSPTPGVLKPGTRFEMALSPGQAATRPGGFGTFDSIKDVDFVRNNLAVKQAWKPDIDRVVTYEVTRDLPVNLGPVGPQVDKAASAYLPGGGSQLEMLVKPSERMNYIKIISERSI
jgi:RHS repeat-associated protein